MSDYRFSQFRFALVVCAAAGICSAVAAKGQAESGLRPNDRIVFLGDSITQAGVRKGGYVTLVGEAIAKHHGDLKVQVIGAGISGHKVPDCQKRLQRDVISKKPTVVVVYIGINDVWHSQNGRGTPQDKFDAGLRDLIGRIKMAGARVILCTPSVIGEQKAGTNPLDKMLDEYSAISRKVAADTDSQMLDLRKQFVDHLAKSNPQNRRRGVLTSDGVHLNGRGNRFVADRVLEALGASSKSGKLLRHAVLFKFKESVTKAQIDEVSRAFAALPGKIDAIHDFEMGTDVSVEGKAKGFTHGYLVTFRTEKDRATYLPHPAHKEFVQLVGPRVEDVLVFDYWTGK